MSSPNPDNESTQDPDHPLSSKNTQTFDKKLTTAAAAATDPRFPLPTLSSESSSFQYIRSFAVLFVLLAGGLGGAYIFDATILQEPIYATVIVGTVLLGVFATGTAWVDWWELCLGYWWLSLPVGAAAGLAFVMMQETATGWDEVS